mgnify:CR=1 FL=1
MQDLKQVNSAILKAGLSDFTLDTGSQSFVKYPTNYIDMQCDNFSICLGHIIYGNITIYDQVFNNIKTIYLNCKDLINAVYVDFVQVTFIESDNIYRVIIDQDGDQHSFDSQNLKDLLNFINNFE